MIEKLKKINFYLIVFFLPLNLGLHYVVNSSYIHGFLVDYFVPTLYLQDIMVLSFIVISAATLNKERLQKLINSRLFVFIVLFLFSVFLSSFNGVNTAASFYAFSRLFLYILFSLAVILFFSENQDFSLFVKVLSVSVLLVSLLGVAQWIRQGAVFNNYLFFGEQPYNFSTYGIVRDGLLGVTKIPAYGLFRHPNVFAGYLVICLIWMLVLVPENKFVTLAYILGVLALFFTLSYFAWAVFVLSLVMVFVPKKISVIFVVFFTVSLVFLPLLRSQSASLSRRSAFLVEAKELISASPMFGIGLNNSPLYAPEARFAQPIHNVFALVFAESGVFAFLFFLAVLFLLVATAWMKKLLLVSLLAVILLSSFDHYFFTINQAQLLFWLTAGVIYSYNSAICGTKS